MSECFVEFSHADTLLLFLSKSVLIVTSISAGLLTLVLIGCYIFDIFSLPIRSFDVLIALHFPHFKKHIFLSLISFITDIVNYGLGLFLAVTYASNFFCILNLFITDTIKKLKW